MFTAKMNVQIIYCHTTRRSNFKLVCQCISTLINSHKYYDYLINIFVKSMHCYYCKILIIGTGACIPSGKKHALISDGHLQLSVLCNVLVLSTYSVLIYLSALCHILYVIINGNCLLFEILQQYNKKDLQHVNIVIMKLLIYESHHTICNQMLFPSLFNQYWSV